MTTPTTNKAVGKSAPPPVAAPYTIKITKQGIPLISNANLGKQ